MPVIEVEDLDYVYAEETPYRKVALKKVSLTVEEGEFFGIAGGNGSGKTTLIQHFNGLLVPTAGKVKVGGKETSDQRFRKDLWKKVGLVFQFPEQQLFEATVYDEVAYGPSNLKLPPAVIGERVRTALTAVGLAPEEVGKLAPLALSGGMRRRVAIASVLAMEPEILVLDEPTAGLDGQGRDLILHFLKRLQQERKTTVIMVSHSLGELIPLIDKLAVLERGHLILYGTPAQVLAPEYLPLLQEVGLPDYLLLISSLAKRGRLLDRRVISLPDAVEAIDRLLEEKMK